MSLNLVSIRMPLRHKQVNGIGVAIKIIKLQPFPDRMAISTPLEVRMQFPCIPGTITALPIQQKYIPFRKKGAILFKQPISFKKKNSQI